MHIRKDQWFNFIVHKTLDFLEKREYRPLEKKKKLSNVQQTRCTLDRTCCILD